MTPSKEPVLFVDLDGTLVATDLLHESFLAAFRRSPWVALQSVGWLLRGRACLKEELASRGVVDVASLPYREPVLEFLREERARGRRIVLATASWRGLADEVARHLGLFDAVLATSREGNLKGADKARRLREHCGAEPFDYVGDSRADLHVWRAARHAYVVGGMVGRMPGDIAVTRAFASPPNGLAPAAWRALRPHQWAKNLLLFLPLVAAHRLVDPAALASAAIAFVAFCLVASSAYLLNDMTDLQADRAHPRKRARPIASGALSIPAAAALCAVCLAAGALLSTQLPLGFAAALAAYFVITLAYSLALKRMAVVDVVALAGLYTTRVVAGAFAVAVDLSFWLLAFAMFLFFSLALVKRYAELVGAHAQSEALPGRGYVAADRAAVLAMGTASAMMSTLVLALYMNGDTVRTLYSRPEALWLLCPLLVFWTCRLWLLAARGQMDDDPVLFAMRDPASYFTAAAGSGVAWLAT